MKEVVNRHIAMLNRKAAGNQDSIEGLSFYALRATVCYCSRVILSSQQALPLKQKAGPEPNGFLAQSTSGYFTV